ncbi:hypothetical protein ACFQJC_10280 [Haloferax namakaokahaiae]|uniref:Uncharacterized protein n=1 Tax=Haloferax namakaokahaiae TaxID=1748331 RepID=A0ABD5ZF48_9EURY
MLELAYADPEHRFSVDDFVVEAPSKSEVEIALRHVHLPKLASGGYIHWNPDLEVFTCGPEFERVRSAMVLLTTHRHVFPGDWV